MKKFIILTFFFIYSNASLACSCASYDLDKAFEVYDYVFKGKVYSASTKWLPAKSYVSLNEFEFQIERPYKGKLGKEITVYSHPQSSACGYPFKEGMEYVVFAIVADKEFEDMGLALADKPLVSICSPTLSTNKGEGYYEKKRKKVLDFLKSKAVHDESN